MARAGEEWFTNTSDPAATAYDLRVLNMATREMMPLGSEPGGVLLTDIRTAYRPGMSAQAVIDAVRRLRQQERR